jgi:hypothetical protein
MQGMLSPASNINDSINTTSKAELLTDQHCNRLVTTRINTSLDIIQL